MHPKLSPIYETDFVVQIVALMSSGLAADRLVEQIWRFVDQWSQQLPHRPHNKREHERYHHGQHHLLFHRSTVLHRTRLYLDDVVRGRAVSGLGTMMRDLFAVHRSLDGKPRWVNKAPAYVQILPVLHRMSCRDAPAWVKARWTARRCEAW